MSKMESHEAAKIFPLMTHNELVELAADIKKHGLNEPITIHEGLILDGRNRYAACELCGLAPQIVEWEPRGKSPLEFVISKNLHRRHLTTAQRAAIGLELLPQFEAEAKERRLDALTPGYTPPSSLSPKVPNEDEAPYKAPRAAKATERVGAMVGTSGRSISRAKAIQEKDESVIDEMRAGTLTINQALGKVGIEEPRPGGAFSIRTKRNQQSADKHLRSLFDGLNLITEASTALTHVHLDKAIAAMKGDDHTKALALIAKTRKNLATIGKQLREETHGIAA